jgi:hypothetical protein
MMEISQSKVIRSSAKWETALFTTFALSLTFFETILLPRLRETKCRQIHVLVDSEGYANSLIERRSSAVGKEFKLIPVVVKSPGIFHPKISYLGGEQDVLMVGSGNLTFGGHGRNVEVLEVLQKSADPQAFLDFADFLDALGNSDRVQIGDLELLGEFSSRARSNIGAIDDSTSLRILHSVDVPIDQQLIEHFEDRQSPDELLCTSPYHHPAARPVQKLIKSLGINQLVVGVPSKKQQPTSFPLHQAEDWKIGLRTVAPAVEKPNRPLHAKWLEFRGAEYWVFTGSVNATKQSLSTTLNVEVGVLRRLPNPTSAQWAKVEAPDYGANEFRFGTKANFLPVYANLNENGLIKGQIIGESINVGVWEAQLHESGNHIVSESVTVDGNLEFGWDVGRLIQVVHGNSIQIELRREDQIARGWLSVQSMLRMSARSRAGIRSISRMLKREDSLEDVQAVLDLIAIHSHRILYPQHIKKSSEAEKSPSEVDDIAIPVHDLSLIEDEGHLVNRLIESESRERSSADVLRLIGQLFRGKKRPAGIGPTSISSKRKATIDDEEDEERQETERKVAALDLFNSQMFGALISASSTGARVEAILFVWLHVNLDMLARDIEQRDVKVFSFAARWMNLVANHCRRQSEEDILSGLVFGIAAILGQYDDKVSDHHLLYQHLGLSLEKLHQCLESYVGGSVSREQAIGDAQAWLQYSSATEVFGEQSDKAIVALECVLKRPTYRAILFSIVKAARDKVPIEYPVDIFDDRARLLIATIQRARNPFSKICFCDRHTTTACPLCSMALLQDTQSKLKSSRIAKCDNDICSRILMDLKP